MVLCDNDGVRAYQGTCQIAPHIHPSSLHVLILQVQSFLLDLPTLGLGQCGFERVGFELAALRPLGARHDGARFVKDGIDLFQATARRFGVEEVDEGQEGKVEDGEDEVAFPALAVHGAGGHHDGGKVPDPVGRGGDGVALGAQVQGHDLGAVEPGHAEEAEGEEGVVEEEGDDDDDGGAVAARAQAEGHGQEAAAHAKGADEQTAALADARDQEGRDDGGGEVPEAVEAGEQQRQVVREPDRGLEQVANVVADGAHAAEHDHGHEPPGEQDAAQVLRLGLVAEQLGPADRLGHALELNGLVDDLDLGLDLVVVLVGDAMHAQQHSDGLGLAVVGHEPARRLGHERDHGQQNDGKDHLRGHREAPLEGAPGVREPIVDPVGGAGAQADEEVLEGAKHLAGLGGQGLGLPDGQDGGVEPGADAGDDAANDELHDAVRGGLDDGADDDDGGAAVDGRAAAHFLAEDEAYYAACE